MALLIFKQALILALVLAWREGNDSDLATDVQRFRSSGAPCEAALMVNLKLLDDLSHSITKSKMESPYFSKIRFLSSVIAISTVWNTQTK